MLTKNGNFFLGFSLVEHGDLSDLSSSIMTTEDKILFDLVEYFELKKKTEI